MLELLSYRRGARTNEVGQDNQRSSVNDKERPGREKWVEMQKELVIHMYTRSVH